MQTENMSILETRFYIGIFLLFMFGIFGVILIIFGFFWEGVVLLAMIAVFSAVAYMTNKRRCPKCGRLYFDNTYEYCPHCGFPLKKEQKES
jgi:hypothetical protein